MLLALGGSNAAGLCDGTGARTRCMVRGRISACRLSSQYWPRSSVLVIIIQAGGDHACGLGRGGESVALGEFYFVVGGPWSSHGIDRDPSRSRTYKVSTRDADDDAFQARDQGDADDAGRGAGQVWRLYVGQMGL